MVLSTTGPTISRKSLLFLVPFLGLIYAGIRHFYALLIVYPSSTLMYSTLTVIPLIGALAVWRGGRIGYVVATTIGLFFILAEGQLVPGTFSAVTVPSYFLTFVTGVPLLVAAAIYSILGLRQVWGAAAPRSPPKMMPISSFVILLALGFIMGGVVVGSFAAQTELGLARGSSGVAANITIVQGAASQSNVQFYSPSSYTVEVGTTVTWVNHDGTTHTVTSTDGTFDSGSMPPGASFSYTFTNAGTYQYACSYHPWMTGTIVVKQAG